MSRNKTIYEIHNALINNQITFLDLYKHQQEQSKKLIDYGYHAILTDLSQNVISVANDFQNKLSENKDNYLFGITSSIKDNVTTKNIRTTGGSRFLEDYIPVFNATLVVNLLKCGVLINNKSNLDEFGLGGTGTYSGYGIVYNPIDNSRITGGSSSGTAVCVATGTSCFGIATDTGDSIRKPASNLGIAGFKPSYGLISRFGVMPFSPSLDTVGILTNDVRDCAIVMDAVSGYDVLDNTSIKDQTKNYFKSLKKVSKFKLLVLDDVFSGMNKNILPKYEEFIKKLESKYEIVHANFGIELLKLIEPIYMTISYAEAVSSWNNLSGLVFGPKIEYDNYEQRLEKLRTNYLGEQLKKRFIIGKWFSSSENFDPVFKKAKMIRTCIIKRAEELLKNVDGIIIPGSSDIAFQMQDVLDSKAKTNYCDDGLQIANFGGYPSITIPFIEYKNNPIGLNIFGSRYDDANVLNIAYNLENEIETFNKGNKND